MINERKNPLFAFSVCIPLVLGTGCGSDDDASRGEVGAGAIDVQISGEELATDGFLFPTASEVTLADGWELQFTHVLVTVGNLTLSENPSKSPSDQSATDRVVARVAGPWAVDLHAEGPATGAGGDGRATPITTLANQNLNGAAPFEADTAYAFGYDIVAASASAAKVNFDGDTAAENAYEEMVDNGYSVMYVGTATFKGDDCQVSDSAYEFDDVPTEFEFRLGFATPVSNINCQNQDNQGDAFEGEEFPRGVSILPNRAAVAQLTLHAEHPFFSDVEHEPALYFDQMAAQLVGAPEGTVLTIDDLVGLDPTAFTDGSGAALPWRVCDGSTLPAGNQRGFEVGSIQVDPAGNPADALRDYRDYVHYVQSTQGHLNGGEGLCFVRRNYPSPR